MILGQQTIHYTTYVKTALKEALEGVFKNHPDELLQETRVRVENPRAKADYPCILLRFNEREINNMGVGHTEKITIPDSEGEPGDFGIAKFKHYLYKADIEFEVLALSSLDRDFIRDTIVQTLAMGDLEAYTNTFFERIYPEEATEHYPEALWHFININTDKITGIPEQAVPPAWGSEDDLVYKSGYRTNTMGEFYSVPPDLPSGYVSKVLLFPYIGGLEAIPDGESGPGQDWQPGLFD